MLLVGRTLLGLLFVVSGIRAAMFYSSTIDYFTRLGLVLPQAMVWLAVLIEVGGGAMLVLGWQTRRIAWFLLAFVVVATVMAHRFWEFEGGQYVSQLNHFLKNMAIIGGLLYVAAIGGGTASVDHRRPR